MPEFITLGARARDLTGQRFGRLVALGPVGREFYRAGTKVIWACRCDCGREHSAFASDLKGGGTRSCGCLHDETFATNRAVRYRHRLSRTPEYKVWNQMWRRCECASDGSFPDYGGRSVKVCERWRRFEHFLADMGPRPTAAHTIERRNGDGNYEPDNCRWETRLVQGRNSRRNLVVAAFGRTGPLSTFIPLSAFAAYERARYRIRRGWDAERAINAALEGGG